MRLLSWKKPSREYLERFLKSQAHKTFTYAAIGATATTPPEGFAIDHTRVQLGVGATDFAAARRALQTWEQFRLGWVEAWPSTTPLQTGEIVAVMGRAIGLWWLNSCRIVYVVDETGPIDRFGFAYGTLPGHVERGEERFLIEWDHRDNSVWYDILAFSRPRHILTKLGYPLVRRKQKRFGRDSAASMLRAVRADTS